MIKKEMKNLNHEVNSIHDLELLNQQYFHVKLKENIAYVTFDMPNTEFNIFNEECIIELSDIVNHLEKRIHINVIVFESSKSGSFIVGADIKKFLLLKKTTHCKEKIREEILKIQFLFDKITQLKIKTIALINGLTLGPGLEFALACDHIVVTDSKKVLLGFPEVKLGIIPSLGGTINLPKRIGLSKSLKYIINGTALNGLDALSIGLADAIIKNEFCYDDLENLIYTNQLTSIRKKRLIIDKLPLLNRLIFYVAQKKLFNKMNNSKPNQLQALHTIKKTLNQSTKKEFIASIITESMLHESNTSDNLIHLFMAKNKTKKTIKSSFRSKNLIKNFGICGAGYVGCDIGSWLMMNKNNVRLNDISWDIMQKGYQKIKTTIDQHTSQHLLMDNVSSSLKYDGFENLDLVIESIPDNFELKKKIFNDLEHIISSKAIIISNTSSLCIDSLNQHINQQHRFLGLHFFWSAFQTPLVEVIPSRFTSKQIINTVCHMIIKNNKIPIIVKNSPGFLINRLIWSCINEATHLISEGYKVTDIDLISKQFGFPLGPLELFDSLGLNYGLTILNSLQDNFTSRISIPQQLLSAIDNKLYGKKYGKGFYKYSKKSKKINYDYYKINGLDIKYNISNNDKTMIMDRLILSMINEASRCIEESVVHSVELLDIVMVMSAGFPSFRGGILRYADQRKLSTVVDRLNQLSDTIGDRFKPSDYLVSLNKKNKSFYDQ